MSIDSDIDQAFAQEYRPLVALHLYGEGVPIGSFDFVQNTDFKCAHCGLENPEALASLITRVNAIEGFQTLSVSQNSLKDLRQFSGLTYSGTLDLGGNPVVNLWPLAETNISTIRAEETALLCSHVEAFRSATGKRVTSVSCLSDEGDEDADGFLNINDRFPKDPAEWSDLDDDYIGDNADDSDGDGVVDAADAFPLDATETLDTDADGIRQQCR